jgi:hypothetical protein
MRRDGQSNRTGRGSDFEELARRLRAQVDRQHQLLTSILRLNCGAAPRPSPGSNRHQADAEQLVVLVGRTMGEQAGAEVDFASRTIVRSCTKAGLLSPLRPKDPRTDQDRRLVERFHGSVVLYGLALSLLGSLAQDTSRSSESARTCALSLLRSGALDAYGAAAEALTLRQPSDDDLSPLPWDEDDEVFARSEG